LLQSSAVDRSQAVDLLVPSNPMTSSNASSRDLHAVTKARFQKEMREELLSKGALDLCFSTTSCFSFDVNHVLYAKSLCTSLFEYIASRTAKSFLL